MFGKVDYMSLIIEVVLLLIIIIISILLTKKLKTWKLDIIIPIISILLLFFYKSSTCGPINSNQSLDCNVKIIIVKLAFLINTIATSYIFIKNNQESNIEVPKKEKKKKKEIKINELFDINAKDALEVKNVKDTVIHPVDIKPEKLVHFESKDNKKVKIEKSNKPKIKCPKCGTENKEDAKYCFVCNATLKKPLTKKTKE